MKSLKRSLLAAAALVAMGTQANAASGQTSVSFNFPNIVILHYISSVTFDVPAAALGNGAIDEGSGGTLNSFSSPTISGNANVGVTISTALNGYKGTINNAWAVRGITASGNIQMQIAVGTQTATNGTSTVTISNLTMSSGSNSGAQFNIAAPGFAASSAVYGNVHMDLDFSQVTTTGSHTGATYTVTATAI